jgi:hypothetical protein
VCFFFVLDEGTSHHSLKAFCATPMKMMSSFFYQFLQLMEHQWNEIDRGKPTTRRKTCLSATLSTTNLTWTWSGTEPRASVVRGRRLTAWVMARPRWVLIHIAIFLTPNFPKYFGLRTAVLLRNSHGCGMNFSRPLTIDVIREKYYWNKSQLVYACVW